MKRYIRASISESTPDWLRKELTHAGGWGNSLKNKLVNKYHIALDKASYSDQPTADSIPIYNLATDYGTVIYCPGGNDDETAIINGRQRKLGSIAKSKLPEMAVDVVYVDLADADNTFSVGERYRDPRYTYRYDPQGKYAGQYRKQEYDYDTKEYKDAGWSRAGMTPANESRARDKSGYKIPTPEERLREYYDKFPDRITNKVDQLYDRLVSVRSKLNTADLRNKDINTGRAYRIFSDAVEDYQRLLDDLKSYETAESGVHRSDFPRYLLRQVTSRASDISERLRSVEALLNGESI